MRENLMLTRHPERSGLIWKLPIRCLGFLNFISYLQAKVLRPDFCFKVIFSHLQKGYSGKICVSVDILTLLISATMNTSEMYEGVWMAFSNSINL